MLVYDPPNIEIKPTSTTFAGGAAEQTLLTIPIGTGADITVIATVIGADTSGDRCCCTIVGHYKREGATVTALVDNVAASPWYLHDSGWDPKLVVSGTSVLVKATPDSANETLFTAGAMVEVSPTVALAALGPTLTSVV